MKPVRPSCTRWTPSQRNLVRRLACVFAALWALRVFLRSEFLGDFLLHPTMLVEGASFYPVFIPALVLSVYLAFIWREIAAASIVGPTDNQAAWGIVLLGIVGTSVALVLHPTTTQLQAMYHFASIDPALRTPAIAAGIEFLYLSLIVPLAMCFVPGSFLRRHRWPLIFGCLLIVLFLCGEIINYYYFRLSGPLLAEAVQWLMSHFPNGGMERASRWHVAYRGFQVMIGPACTDFSAMVLLIGMLGFVWWRRRPSTRRAWLAASTIMVGGVAGLFGINVLRIALIMVVGTWWPSFAIGLFHSSIGALVLFAYTAALTTLASHVVRSAVRPA